MTWLERLKSWLPGLVAAVAIGAILWFNLRPAPGPPGPMPLPTPDPTPDNPLVMLAEVSGEIGTIIEIAPKALVKFRLFAAPCTDNCCQVKIMDASAIVVFKGEGECWLGGTYADKAGLPVNPLWTRVKCGKGPQPPPPGPGPGPKPDPAPIPVAGLRVLIVAETADLSKYSYAQQLIMTSRAVKDYLDAKCVPGPDGKAEWRVWDKDTDVRTPPLLATALKRPRTELPWVVISNGKSGYEGKLPEDCGKFLELVKRYEP